MIDTKDITKMVHHIMRRDAGIPDKRVMHPVRDWYWALSCSVLIALLGCGAAVYLFWERSKIDIESYTTEIQTVTYDANAVAAVLAEYEKRARRHAQLRGGAVGADAAAEEEDVAGDASIEVE